MNSEKKKKKEKKKEKKSYDLCNLVFSLFKAAFFNDLHWAPFTEVLNCTDPDKALETWYNVYLTVVNRHAPLKRKRVKHPKLPPWLNKKTMAERDKLKRENNYP